MIKYIEGIILVWLVSYFNEKNIRVFFFFKFKTAVVLLTAVIFYDIKINFI